MGYFFLGLALTLNAVANVLLKIGAGHLGRLDAPDLVGRLLTNSHLLAGLVLFALNVVFYAAALTRLNLSVAYPVMTAGGVLIVVTVSFFLLKEPIAPAQILGLLLIVAGILLVAQHPVA